MNYWNCPPSTINGAQTIDISCLKGRVRGVTSAKKVTCESPQNEKTMMLREKLDDIKEVVDTIVHLCSARLGVFEQDLPLDLKYGERTRYSSYVSGSNHC